LSLKDGKEKKVRINRLHLEQDAGKNLHDISLTNSYVDLNRAGIGLMEIVSEPDMHSAEEAGVYVRTLRSVLRYLGTCDGNMQEGSLRVDANVSVHKKGEDLGTPVEIKNINSVNFLEKAIAFEAQRQIACHDAGHPIIKETRLFQEKTGETLSMRLKETAQDYRYFPDPDLPPLQLDVQWVEEIQSQLPELPDEKKARWSQDWQLSEYDTHLLAEEPELAQFFETTVQHLPNVTVSGVKRIANWILGDLFAWMKKNKLSIIQQPLSTENLAQLVHAIDTKQVSSSAVAKKIFEHMVEKSLSFPQALKALNFQTLSDEDIHRYAQEVIRNNPQHVANYQGGKTTLIEFFIGQVMKKTRGQSDPAKLRELFTTLLQT